MEKILAIIPARGGSKRIPGKNIREFCGKPIIAYSIEAAHESGLFGHIVCSTDSDEIADVARRYGAELPFKRPEELANDFVGTDAVIMHALENLLARGWNLEYACCIYPTAPMLMAEDIRRGFQILKASGASSAFSVTAYEFSIYRALQINSSGHLEMIWPENRLKRSQDLPVTYHDAAQFYWIHVPKFMKTGKVYGADAMPVMLPRWRVQDTDTFDDWRRAEHVYRLIMKEISEQRSVVL